MSSVPTAFSARRRSTAARNSPPFSTSPEPTTTSVRCTRTCAASSSSNNGGSGGGRKQPAAAHRARRTGRGGQAQWQSEDRANRQIGESLGLERVAIPPNRLNGSDRYPEIPSERRHDRRVVAAAAAHQPFARRTREMTGGGRDRGGGHLGQGRGAVGKRRAARHRGLKVVAVERFRREPLEVRMSQEACHVLGGDLA